LQKIIRIIEIFKVLLQIAFLCLIVISIVVQV
jgi:hypothetical protein